MALHKQHFQISELISAYGRRNKTAPAAGHSNDNNLPPGSLLYEDDIGPRLVQRLRNHNLRPSMARIAVLTALEQSAPHCLDAGQLYVLLKQQLAQATVYRVLYDIWAAGLLVRSRGEQNRTRYGLKPDGHNTNSFAFGCQCGARVVFIEDQQWCKHLRSLADQAGFDIDDEPVFMIATTCASCRKTLSNDR